MFAQRSKNLKLLERRDLEDFIPNSDPNVVTQEASCVDQVDDMHPLCIGVSSSKRGGAGTQEGGFGGQT